MSILFENLSGTQIKVWKTKTFKQQFGALFFYFFKTFMQFRSCTVVSFVEKEPDRGARAAPQPHEEQMAAARAVFH